MARMSIDRRQFLRDGTAVATFLLVAAIPGGAQAGSILGQPAKSTSSISSVESIFDLQQSVRKLREEVSGGGEFEQQRKRITRANTNTFPALTQGFAIIEPPYELGEGGYARKLQLSKDLRTHLANVVSFSGAAENFDEYSSSKSEGASPKTYRGGRVELELETVDTLVGEFLDLYGYIARTN